MLKDFVEMVTKAVGKTRNFLIDKSELTDLLELLNRLEITVNPFMDLSVVNCGWKKAPSVWSVRFRCNQEVYINVLRALAESNIHILPETTGY